MELNAFEKSGILSQQELQITEQYSTAALIKALSTGQITAMQATLAFSKRAAIAQQLVRHSEMDLGHCILIMVDQLPHRDILS